MFASAEYIMCIKPSDYNWEKELAIEMLSSRQNEETADDLTFQPAILWEA